MTEISLFLMIALIGYYFIVFGCLTEGGFDKKWQFFVSLIPFVLIIWWIYIEVKEIGE